MKWITRKDVKVDRVACPWLIKKFVDPEAEFLFVPESELLTRAKEARAIPFDAPRQPDVQLNHRGEKCTFEAIVEDYDLKKDPAIARLALIVRAADIQGQESVAPEGPGLRAIAHGLAFMTLTDQERVAHGFVIYDALYQYCRRQVFEF